MSLRVYAHACERVSVCLCVCVCVCLCVSVCVRVDVLVHFEDHSSDLVLLEGCQTASRVVDVTFLRQGDREHRCAANANKVRQTLRSTGLECFVKVTCALHKQHGGDT
jgi:hypothetical protein